MVSSLELTFAALALGGIFAALWGVIRISKRLESLEATQAELRDGVRRMAENVESRLGEGTGAAGEGTGELLPRRYPPPPLPLRRTSLVRGARAERLSFGEAVRESAREVNFPALVLVALLILGFAFFLGTFRLRDGEANHGTVPAPTSTAPAAPAVERPAPGAAAPPAAPGAVARRVTVGETALRADPSVQSAVLAVIPAFTQLQIRPVGGAGWAEVEWRGMRGFVRSDVLAEAETPGR